MERIFTGKKMEVQNLYYDINQSKLRADAKQELQKVITLMKDNPNLTLELGAHTDSRGTDSENQNLSERRATSAVDYLIMKGDIAKARIVSKGYGENILLNNCGDGSKCPDAEHAKNRRTELKIVGITNVAEIKSLKKMKEEMHMEEEILQLMDQDEIIAGSIEELKNRLQKAASEEIDEVDEVDEVESNVEQPTTEDIQDVIETKIEEIKKEVTIPAKTKKVKKDFDDMPALEVLHQNSKITDESKIVLYRSTEPLSVNHPMFKQHKTIEIFRDTDRTFNYMIRGFKTSNETQSFYNTYIKSQYKESFLATIVDGKMIRK
jgi:hypothetical protein